MASMAARRPGPLCPAVERVSGACIICVCGLLQAAVLVWLCWWTGAAAASEASSSTADGPVMEPAELEPPEEAGCGGGAELSCDRWLQLEPELGPPPDFLSMVPPPPVPEFMEDYVQRLHQASGECLLCNWAHNNDSLLLVGDGESGQSHSWGTRHDAGEEPPAAGAATNRRVGPGLLWLREHVWAAM